MKYRISIFESKKLVMSSIGKKIFEARKMKGFTQEELAELSKVNLRTIQRIENNKSEPRGKTLNLICNALEIDFIEFQEINQLKRINIISILINFIFIFCLIYF